MVGQAGAPSNGLASYLLTDPKILGLVGWAGLLLGVISLAVTVAGFVIALRQIRQVQAVSQASKAAADGMMEALKRQDVTASLSEARSHLKLARLLMRSNPEAAGAYVDTSCNALTQVHQIRQDQDDDELVVHILNLREVAKFLQSISDPNPTPSRIRKMHSDITNAANAIDNLIAKRRYQI